MENTPTSFDENAALALLEQMAGFAGPAGAALGAAVGGRKPPADSPGRGKGWQPDLRYRSLVEKLPVVTFMASLDESMQELYVSPQIESLLGFTQEEWLDNPILWFRQLHPDDREAWVNEFARTCATGAHFRAEYRLIARDGRTVWVQGECQVVRDDDGRPAFLQGIAFDITHLKRAAQVEEAKLAAEAASRAKSEFLARMSHEIRTPLNGVVGMIDLLRATELSDVQRRYTHLAREAADSLLGVINDILDFSKIEANKVEIEAVEFDLHKVVEDLTELLAPVAAKKGLALACVLRPDVPRRLTGDPNRIRQVLTNLVGNALKFTTRGQVGIRAVLESRGDDGVIVRVRVTDTGIGIPPDRLDRLFKSFSQVDTSTTRKFGGTGLGLAISKRLVELMGGEVGIESVEGQGTTFWFTLKLGAVNAPEAAAPGGAVEALPAVRVLAAESDPAYRQILAEQFDGILSPASEVVAPADAPAALRRAAGEGRPFAAALVPYGTPDGAALAAAVRGDPALRATPLVAVLGIDDRTDAAAVAGEGFRARLYRPVTQSCLLAAVAAATAAPAAGDAQSSAAEPATAEPLKGLHLLVAEDNEINQLVTRETLAWAGCTCDVVADGALAVAAVGRGGYDAVLMDCQMPGMDGLEASRRIRAAEAANPPARRLPIIALTADAIQGDREKCLSAGMDGYVTKPIDADDLIAAILSLARAGGPAVSNPPPAEVAAPAPAVAPPAGAADPIDITALLGYCLGDPDFARCTLEQAAPRAAADAAGVCREAAARDLDAVTRLAKSLKAAAAELAAASLAAVAAEIEQAGARRDLAFVEQQLARLQAEAARCAEFLSTAMGRVGGDIAGAARR